MKRFIILSAMFLFCLPCFAINWEEIRSPQGMVSYLDLDSIREIDGYYFYNVKFDTSLGRKKEYKIITIQSNHSTPFSARIAKYNPNEYASLNGDYENIAKNKTENLEPVTFNSTVHICYKKVKRILQNAKKPEITIN